MNMLSKLALAVVAMVVLALGPISPAWAQVKVTSADPAETSQGTVSLEVAVNGSGFNSSAAVKFLVAGTTDTGGVTVKKVTFKSSKQLIATIDVGVSASVNKFDIEVALSDGRKGKGTTLFTVLKKVVNTLPDPCASTSPNYTSNWAGFPAFAYVLHDDQAYTYEIRVASRNGMCSKRVGAVQPGKAGYTSLASNAPGEFVIAWSGPGSMIARFSVPSVGETDTTIPATFTVFRSRGGSGNLSPDGAFMVYPYGSEELYPLQQLRIASLSDMTGDSDTVVQIVNSPSEGSSLWWAPWGKIYYTETNLVEGKRLLAISPYALAPQVPEVLLQFPPADPLVVNTLFQIGQITGGYVGYDPAGPVPNVIFQGYYTTGITRGGKSGSGCAAVYAMNANTHEFVLGSLDMPSSIIGRYPSLTVDGTVLYNKTTAPASGSTCMPVEFVGESAFAVGSTPQVSGQMPGSWPVALKAQ